MVMRTLVERSQGRELVLVDGVKVLEDDGWALVLPDPEEPLTHVWAEAGERRRRPRPGPRSTPSGSSSCCADAGAADPVGGAAAHRAPVRYRPHHERARRSALLDATTSGPAPRVTGSGSGSPTTPRTPSATWSSSSSRQGRRSRPGGLLGEVESTKSVSEIYAPVAGEVVAVNAALADAPETAERGPLRRGLDLRDRPRRPVRGGGAARRRRLPAADRS